MDPVVLERARMQQVSGGMAPEPWSAAGTMVYVALQELATRISHFNTAKALDDPAGYHEWAIVLDIDLDASDQAGEPAVRPVGVERL